jgi:hypothetical protein
MTELPERANKSEIALFLGTVARPKKVIISGFTLLILD